MSSVTCTCGTRVVTRPEWRGKRIRCPGCSSTLYVPYPRAAATPPEPLAALPRSPTRYCPFCHEVIRTGALKCRFCGEWLSPSARPGRLPPPEPPARTSDGGGTVVLVLGILGWTLCPFLWPIAWAMGTAREARCRKDGIAPSGALKAGRLLGKAGTLLLLVVLGLAVAIAFLGD